MMVRSGEQGYVLIATIWLLVLAGSIVALLMLGSVHLAQQAKDSGTILRERLALDAATETIIADRIVNGDRSIWSRAPTEAVLDIEGIAIQAKSTSEAKRIDINRADASVIDTVLRRAHVSSVTRQRLLARLAIERGAGRPIASMADLEEFLSAAEVPPYVCLDVLFTTILGGQVTISNNAAVESHASSGGNVSAVQLRESLSPGAPQRLELRTQAGLSRTVIFRPAGQRDQSASFLDRASKVSSRRECLGGRDL